MLDHNSVLLRGVYETAMKYGFSYETPEEKMFILKMLETAMTTGEEWEKANKEVDCYTRQDIHMIPTEEEVKQQIEKLPMLLQQTCLLQNLYRAFLW